MIVKIREANRNDWEAIQRIGKTVFEANEKYDTDIDMGYPYSEVGTKYYKSMVDFPKRCVFVAEVGKISVGYLYGGEFKCDYRKVTYGEIRDMGVLPEYRRIGIGSMLVIKFREWCGLRGYKKIYVNAYYEDERAVSFYKKQGLIPLDLILVGKV